MNKLFFLLFLGILILPGCMRLNSSMSEKSAYAYSTHWTMRGKIGIHTPQQNGSVLIHWQQTGENYHIRLFGPLGMGTVDLQGNPHHVTLTDAQGKIYQADSPELLLNKTLRFQIPISNLAYWIQGSPAPGFADKKIFIENHFHQKILNSFRQQGWQIHYLSYNNYHHEIIQNRPRLMDLKYLLLNYSDINPPINSPINLRLMINEFSS